MFQPIAASADNILLLLVSLDCASGTNFTSGIISLLNDGSRLTNIQVSGLTHGGYKMGIWKGCLESVQIFGPTFFWTQNIFGQTFLLKDRSMYINNGGIGLGCLYNRKALLGSVLKHFNNEEAHYGLYGPLHLGITQSHLQFIGW